MSQQINLYDPALLRKRELLSALNLALACGVLALGLSGWGASLRVQLAKAEAENAVLSPQLKSAQDQVMILGKAAASAKPDPALEREVLYARERLRLRGEVLAALQRGVGADTPRFAEYLRGFARQTPKGLWLTGFSVRDGGVAMEIQGRMIDPALLPEYINRLNGERAFKGRAFAALRISSGKMEPSAPKAEPASGKAAPSNAASAPPQPFLEFTLVPMGASASPAAAQEPKGSQRPPESAPPAEGPQAAEGRR